MSDLERDWLFGYGSLLFRRGFPVDECHPARINDWSRRFWQGSPDHRGRPGAPGRVVTLVETPGVTCGGVALRLPKSGRRQVVEKLDRREAAGYRRIELDIHIRGGRRVDGFTYVADSGNADYLGPAPIMEVAAEITKRTGPSGSNSDYLLMLARSLREAGMEDPHVSELESAVLSIMNGTSR